MDKRINYVKYLTTLLCLLACVPIETTSNLSTNNFVEQKMPPSPTTEKIVKTQQESINPKPIPSFPPGRTPPPSGFPIHVPTPTPDPFKNLRALELYGYSPAGEIESSCYGSLKQPETLIVCENIPKDFLNSKLSKPIDITVNADGNTIYAIGQREANKKVAENGWIRKRQFIYKVSSEKPKVLTFDNLPPLSCELDEEIELDENGDIIVNSLGTHKIYKIQNNGETKMIYSSDEQWVNPLTCYPSDLVGPKNILQLKNDTYFLMEQQDLFGIRFFRKLVNNLTFIPVVSSVQTQISAITFDEKNNYYFVEKSLNQIFKIDLENGNKNEPFFIGSGTNSISSFSGSGKEAFRDGTKDEASFNHPLDIKIDKNGDLIVCDTKNHAIRKVLSNGDVVTIAGNGKAGYLDGRGKGAYFNSPHSIDLDNFGNIYVADTGNDAIRKISFEGYVSTLYKAVY